VSIKTKTAVKTFCCVVLCLPLLMLHWQRAAAQTGNSPNSTALFEQRSNSTDQGLEAAKASTIAGAQGKAQVASSGVPVQGPPANFCMTDVGRCPLPAATPAGQNCVCTVGNLSYGGKTAAVTPTPATPSTPTAPASSSTVASHPAPVQPVPPPAQPPSTQPSAVSNQPVIRVSILAMVRNSDVIVQAVMLFLLFCSGCSWAAFLYKSVVLAIARRNTQKFAIIFQTATTMDDAGEVLQAARDGPAWQMWMAAKQEWDSTLRAVEPPLTAHQSNRLLQRLVLAMGTAQEHSLTQLGGWMGLLATVSSTAPFIGLFGTVWGILDSFEHISVSSSTSLTVVAPGIAEALLATAVGLFTAIPATMFYNRFAREIGRITGMLDNATAEMIVFASRDIERLGK
jgi:biopolymer transport protein ExbB/TolQ